MIVSQGGAMKNWKYAIVALLASAGTQAAPPILGASSPMPPAGGARQLVKYPPDVKAHTLANMRGHLEAVGAIMDAMATGKYDQAADIADARLGMNSPGAAGCRPHAAAGMAGMMASDGAHMDHMMSRFMPPGMRELGQNMHRSANTFAAAAREAAKSGNAAPAMAALSTVLHNCAACHARYRLN
jgi:hypothetical protein